MSKGVVNLVNNEKGKAKGKSKLAPVQAGKMTFGMPSDKEVVFERTFDAPRELVFKTYTDPRLVERWWGPNRMRTVVKSMDVKAGGKWRFINIDPEGKEFAFRGEYREVLPPWRLVNTFEFEMMPGHISEETVTFEEHDGKTTVTGRSVFATKADRDGMISTGMEGGLRESMGRLHKVLHELMRKKS